MQVVKCVRVLTIGFEKRNYCRGACITKTSIRIVNITIINVIISFTFTVLGIIEVRDAIRMKSRAVTMIGRTLYH